MTEAADSATKTASVPVIENKTFNDLLQGLIGKTVTIVTTESYEDAPVGHQIRAGYYRAKPVGLGEDYLIIMAEYVHAGREASKEPVKQYIPLSKIKRVSLMKTERLIHI